MQLEAARNEMFEEQATFQETTSESKILVSELKTELEAARSEIAQMKKPVFLSLLKPNRL